MPHKIPPRRRGSRAPLERLRVMQPNAKLALLAGDDAAADMTTGEITITRTFRLHRGALAWLVASGQMVRRPTIEQVA